MKTITKQRAQEIAGQWHGGQNSALYSFASTGQFVTKYTLQYFKEIQSDIEPEYWHAREISRSKKDISELNSLKRFLLKEASKKGFPVELHPHPVYGYMIPYLCESTPDEKVNEVEPVKYLA